MIYIVEGLLPSMDELIKGSVKTGAKAAGKTVKKALKSGNNALDRAGRQLADDYADGKLVEKAKKAIEDAKQIKAKEVPQRLSDKAAAALIKHSKNIQRKIDTGEMAANTYDSVSKADKAILKKLNINIPKDNKYGIKKVHDVTVNNGIQKLYDTKKAIADKVIELESKSAAKIMSNNKKK